MDELMLWIEVNLTYENLVALANVLATVAFGFAFVYNRVKQTQMTLAKNTDIVSNVNKSMQPMFKTEMDKSLKVVLTKVEGLENNNRRLMEATILAMSNDAESRLAAIKLLSENPYVSKSLSYEAEKVVIDEIKEVANVEKEIEKVKEVVAEKIVAALETL
jgi:hypothetical protein